MKQKLSIALAALLLVGAGCAPAPAPTPVPPSPTPDTGRITAPPPGMSLYANASHEFLLYYPTEITPITDRTQMASSGYIPACDPDHAIVCFPYGKQKYAGTNFESAAFAVHQRDDLKTEATCLAPDNGERASGTVAINGTTFSVFAAGDAAMSHRLDGNNNRTFRKGSCIELSTRIGTTVFEVWAPGTIKKFTDKDNAAVQATLDGMLRSFKFQVGLDRS